MTEIATSDRTPQRVAIIAASTVVGVMFAAALVLWGYYGTAVFTETILAGLSACF